MAHEFFFPKIWYMYLSFFIQLWNVSLSIDGVHFHHTNETNNLLSPQLTEHKKRHMTLEIQVLPWDRQKCPLNAILTLLSW